MEEKIYFFALRTEMNDLSHNFGRSAECKSGCKEDMTNSHIFMGQNPNRMEMETTTFHKQMLRDSFTCTPLSW